MYIINASSYFIFCSHTLNCGLWITTQYDGLTHLLILYLLSNYLTQTTNVNLFSSNRLLTIRRVQYQARDTCCEGMLLLLSSGPVMSKMTSLNYASITGCYLVCVVKTRHLSEDYFIYIFCRPLFTFQIFLFVDNMVVRLADVGLWCFNASRFTVSCICSSLYC